MQTDSIQRSEIAKNLRTTLAPDAPVLECAAARNAFTKQRIKQDFIDGYEEGEARGGGEREPGSIRLPRPPPSHDPGSSSPHRLEEMQRSAGDAAMSRAQLTARYSLPVFTVRWGAGARRVGVNPHTTTVGQGERVPVIHPILPVPPRC